MNRDKIPQLLQFLSTMKSILQPEESQKNLSILLNHELLQMAYVNRVAISESVVSEKICAHCCHNTENEEPNLKKNSKNSKKSNPLSDLAQGSSAMNIASVISSPPAKKRSHANKNVEEKTQAKKNENKDDYMNSEWMKHISRDTIQNRFRNKSWKPRFERRSQKIISLGGSDTYTSCKNCGFQTFRGVVKTSKMRKKTRSNHPTQRR